MRLTNLKAILRTAIQGATVLLLGTCVASAQQQVNLAAGPTTLTLPDGSTVPMWSYTCGAVVSGSTATCAKLNPTAAAWSPVVITVPTGATGGLTINLTNNLLFANGNKVPTSIMIVGQVGGGLGSSRTTTPSPAHGPQVTTWPTADVTGVENVPPSQGPRVQSFATEVAEGATTALPWQLLKPGTYLLESGTHPSIQVPMGLYGILVVTAAPTAPAGVETAAGTAYPAIAATTNTPSVPAVTYDAEVPMELSEIDPVQNTTVSAAVNTAGFLETNVWSGQPGGCGNSASGAAYLTCYPPAVNYTPLYYMINGVAFTKASPAASLFPVAPASIMPASGTTGSILVRFVNAGLRMHVPAIVGSQVAGQTGATNPIVTGFKVIAEDGNPLPGLPKIKSEVFMAAGKTYDVMINGKSTSGTTITPYTQALAVYDRELSLSGNGIERDAGMLAYIGTTGPLSTLPVVPLAVVANPDTYKALVAGVTLTVSDPSKGVIANDLNVYGVKLLTPPTNGTVTLAANGSFTYVPTGTATSDSFTYCANGSVTGTTCSSGISATVTLSASDIADTAGVTCSASSFTSLVAGYLAVKTPGVLANCTDGAGLPVTVNTTSIVPAGGFTVHADANGGFTASGPASAATFTFTFTAQNSHKVMSTPTTVTVNFPAGSGLAVTVLDGQDKTTKITDYRWIIEEDRTFYIDPKCSTNPPPAGCPTVNIAGQGVTGIVPTLGTNFHTSYMPYVAQGCTGSLSCEGGQSVLGVSSVCDVGNGACRPDPGKTGMTATWPSQVKLDPTKRYYISILPGDAANPFVYGYAGSACQSGTANAGGATNGTVTGAQLCGHGMGGAPVAAPCAIGTGSCNTPFAPVTVITQPSPYPPGKLSVFVFEDDFPLNGEADGGGGNGVLSPNEPGLGGFQLHLWDAMGGNGDFTGQMTYDMFNQPLTNGLAGTKDPNNGNDACPISANSLNSGSGTTDPTATGITGMIVTCPKYESDGKTLSPLAGQAIVENLMPGRWGVIATPGADRIARGEEWLQTNTLDGQKAHDVFTRIGEPSYFQEFGPASYHVSIGFANPAIINARKPYICNGTDPFSPQPGTGYTCNNTITGKVTGQRLSRTPDERLYSSGSHDTYYWTQCYVSFGDPDGEDFAFTKCAGDGTFSLSGLPAGDWRVTVFDQWNDLLVDGLSTPISISGGGGTTAMGDISTTQWQADLYTRTFIDENKDGLSTSDEAGIPFANVAVRLRDGSLENLLVTDFTGTANFNETFPLFSWYTVETDVTRYKNTGTHVVYDVGGPADGGPGCGTTGYPPCGSSTIGKNLANTAEIVSVPANLRVPGAVYCANADCTGKSIQNGSGTSDPPSVCTTSTTIPPVTTCSTQLSSGRIDPPWVGVEGWQGFPGQNNFLEFGKEPYVAGENGGIKGHVIYASTRPFDDPQMLVQTQWESLVPHVGINLYQEGLAVDGVTPTLTLVDHTQTSSWDDFAQGFHLAADGVTKIPNMNCPGQGASTGPIPDLFYFSLYNQPDYLDYYNNVQHGSSTSPTQLPANSQYKCYDGMHNWNQIQPAPYDGAYKFPSVTATDANGKPTLAGTNCTICKANTAVPTTDLYYGIPQLPPGKYVVEVVLPPGYELVKEEDKNILIGDNYIAPVTQEFGGLGNIFIIPDQASVAAQQQTPGAGYNQNNAQNPTQSLGAAPEESIVPGFIPEPIWPCVGEARIVPDYISLYPQSKQVAPFAGATRNLCDRKEVTLNDQMGAIAKFYIYTSTHIASKFTGGITDDYTSEFDPFSPQFGEKFAPPDLPVAIRDWAGNEISRVYADHWGSYDGMTYSTWEVNPPNPTGYSPTMMVFCMNDPGPIPGPGGTMINDPAYTPGYSQFCYELPFMPGTTQYLDTPVVPTSAFAGAGYNNVDCAYPDGTPAISEVDSADGIGPWVASFGHTITINSLGAQSVPNNAYNGPAATTAPYNQRTITRHYGFGATQGTGSVTIGGVKATIMGWSDTQITAMVNCTPTPGQACPSTLAAADVQRCPVIQQAQYGTGGLVQCGQLVVTAGNGKQSIDTVTVTIGGQSRPPTHVAASASIQTAIDQANPGDMLIIDPTCTHTVGTTSTTVACDGSGGTVTTKSPAAHSELLIMWKPVRLQGVGAASSIINANTQPAGKLDAWRQRVVCLFGLSLNGVPTNGTTNPFDPTGAASCPGNGWNYFVGNNDPNNPQVDPLPLEAIVGWDATQNGNLAQLLQEPTLMGALEGAGITVLGKGVNFPSPLNAGGGAAGELGGFPTGTTLLSGPVTLADSYTTDDDNPLCTSGANGANQFPSNYMCNPSSIDGLTITDSSQGGGGIFVHGWAHNLQIANNRIYSNAGTLSGGINLGQGEFAPSSTQGNTLNAPPGSCVTSGIVTGAELPYCENLNVNIHNNNVSLNSSTGDELFSATPAGAGGVSICTGSDFYKFNYNWICGNLSSGDGGGAAHMGFSFNGDIEHNSILFNQSLNPTIPANGGGLLVMGTPDVDTTCGGAVDTDCLDPAVLRTPSDGVGPNLVINANLIMGNAAEAGSGGGLRLQNVNGGDVLAFPTTPSQWYAPVVTNNIIADNVAGWDGAGISMVDALNVNIINNTIVSNSTTASAGILFTTIDSPLASSSGSNCMSGKETSCPQVAGLVSVQNSAGLVANLPASVTCPAYHSENTGGTGVATSAQSNGTCRMYSYPLLENNIFWQNSAYYIGVGALSAQYQQNVVSLYNAFTTTLTPTQPQADATTANGGGVTITGGTGACTAASYWDIGARGDLGPNTHDSGVHLYPYYSVLTSTSTGGYNGTGFNNSSSNPNFASQYCDGSRQPPESGTSGWAVPPGIADAQVPNPVFNLTPVATVDEGNNWINLRWGPLSLVNPVTLTPLGNYGLTAAIDSISTSEPNFSLVPKTDFFGNKRPETGTDTTFDPGAVEFAGGAAGSAILSVTGGPLAFGNQNDGTTSAARTLTLHNTGTAGATGIGLTFSTPVFSRPAGGAGGTCTTTLAAASTCTINVVFSPTTPGAVTGATLAIAANVSVTGSPVTLTGTGVVPPIQTFTVTGSTLNTLAFGLTQLVDSTSATQTLTIKNTGSVTMTNLAATFGGGSTQFARAATGGTDCGTPITLTAGSSCTYGVVFAPKAAGIYSRTLTFALTGWTGTGTPVTLTGTSIGAALTISAPAPSLVTGTTTAHTGTITVTNSGLLAVVTLASAPTIARTSGAGTFTIVTGTGAGTCINGKALTLLAPSCTIVVSYSAGNTNTSVGDVTVTDTMVGATGTATQTGSTFNAN